MCQLSTYSIRCYRNGISIRKNIEENNNQTPALATMAIVVSIISARHGFKLNAIRTLQRIIFTTFYNVSSFFSEYVLDYHME